MGKVRLGWKRLWLASAIATVLAAPPTASAVTSRVSFAGLAGSGRGAVAAAVNRALALADRHFGSVCPAGVTARWTSLPAQLPDHPDSRMWARALPGHCTIQFSREVYEQPDWRRHVYSWPYLCTLVVHEYGHLAGHGHSADPRDVMYPVIRRPWAGCMAPAARR